MNQLKAIARLRRRFIGAESGATALEFSIVAVPFLLILFAVIETGMFFVINVSLNNATASMARQVRVGSIVAPGISGASSGSQLSLNDFKARICASLPLIPSSTCSAQLQVDVRPLSSFSASAPPSPFSGRSFDSTGFCYYSGTSGSLVEMRVYYLWKLLTPLLLDPLANVTTMSTSSGSATGQWMAASAVEVFPNEPSSNPTNTGAGC